MLEPVGLRERTNLGSFPFQKLQLSLQQAPPVKARPSKPLRRRRSSLAVRQRQAGRPARSNLRSSLSPSRLGKQSSSGLSLLSLLACVFSLLSALSVAQGYCIQHAWPSQTSPHHPERPQLTPTYPSVSELSQLTPRAPSILCVLPACSEHSQHSAVCPVFPP